MGRARARTRRRPTSTRQRAANARNAARSTGPADTTVTRFNATRHAIFSQGIVVPGLTPPEEARQFEQFRDSLCQDLAPMGALEELLADRLATTAWRLRRVLQYETYEIRCKALDAPEEHAAFAKLRAGLAARLGAPDEEPPEARPDLQAYYGLPLQIVLDKVQRYEAHLSRQFDRALHALRQLQAGRDPRSAPTPAAPTSGRPGDRAAPPPTPAPPQPEPEVAGALDAAPSTETGTAVRVPSPSPNVPRQPSPTPPVPHTRRGVRSGVRAVLPPSRTLEGDAPAHACPDTSGSAHRAVAAGPP